MLFNKGAARRHIFAHQHRKHMVGSNHIGQRHLDQGALRRIHRRLPQLVGVHLPKTLVALDFNPFSAIGAEEFDHLAQRVDRCSLCRSSSIISSSGPFGDQILVKLESKAFQPFFKAIEVIFFIELDEMQARRDGKCCISSVTSSAGIEASVSSCSASLRLFIGFSQRLRTLLASKQSVVPSTRLTWKRGQSPCAFFACQKFAERNPFALNDAK